MPNAVQRTLLFLFCLGFLSAGRLVPAADAPQTDPQASGPAAAPSYQTLLTKKTSALICFNVEKLDLGALTQKIVGFISTAVDQVMGKNDQAAQIKMMVPLMLGSYLTGLSPLVDAMKAEKISELYYIFTPESENESPGFIAIPVGDRSKESLQPLEQNLLNLKNLGLPIRRVFVRHGFLFAPFANAFVSDNQFKEYLRARFKTLTPFENRAFGEFLDQAPDAAVCAVYVNTPAVKTKLLEMIDEYIEENTAHFAESHHEQTTDHKESLYLFMENFDGGLAAIRNDFSGIDATVQFESADTAKKIPDAWNKFKNALASFSAESNPEAPKESSDLIGRAIDLLAPTIAENSARWTFDKAFADQFVQVVKDYYSFVMALETIRAAQKSQTEPQTEQQAEPQAL